MGMPSQNEFEILWTMTKAAPGATLTVAAFLFGLGFAIGRWFLSQRNEILQERVHSRDEDIRRLEERLRVKDEDINKLGKELRTQVSAPVTDQPAYLREAELRIALATQIRGNPTLLREFLKLTDEDKAAFYTEYPWRRSPRGQWLYLCTEMEPTDEEEESREALEFFIENGFVLPSPDPPLDDRREMYMPNSRAFSVRNELNRLLGK